MVLMLGTSGILPPDFSVMTYGGHAGAGPPGHRFRSRSAPLRSSTRVSHLLNSSKHLGPKFCPEGDAGPDSLGPLMDAQVPAVVAVSSPRTRDLVRRGALASLAAQDYEELSVLVLATGDAGP
jgi:hypothetical protein